MSVRVFLDAADIIRVADVDKKGADPIPVDRLLSAFKAHDARLYVTRQLQQDLMAKVDDPTIERVIRAFERFVPVIMALTLDDGIIVEHEVTEIREVLEFPGRNAALREARETNDRIHEAFTASMEELDASGSALERGLSDDHFRRYFDAIAAAADRRTSARAEFDRLTAEAGERLSERESETLVARLSAADALLSKALAEPTNLRQLLRPLLEQGPAGDGLRAMALFQTEYMKNTARKPRPSDLLDALHVENVELVDIFTCDRHTMGLLRRAGLDKKRATLLPTGRFDEVAAEIERKSTRVT